MKKPELISGFFYALLPGGGFALPGLHNP